MERQRVASRLTGDHGYVTLWLLGLAVTLLFLGGISFDLWSVFVHRRAMAAAADTAARAGATGIDWADWASAGDLVLNPDTARLRALESLARQDLPDGAGPAEIDVTPGAITVAIEAQAPYTLLRLLLPDEPFRIRVDATAVPLRAS